MLYLGVDHHKQYSQLVLLNQAGELLAERRVANRLESLEEFLGDWEEPVAAVLEASRSWGNMYDLLEQVSEQVVLAHPWKVRAIPEAQVKTDRVDARVLAHLLRLDWVPGAYIPPRETREKRNLLRQRIFLVRRRTMVKNRIHVLLDRNHVPEEEWPQVSDLFGRRGLKFLREVTLSEREGWLLRQELQLLEELNAHIARSDEAVKRLAQEDPRSAWLQSIPGIGPFFALLLLLEIDTIERFANPAKLVAYAGLIPSTSASGGKVYHGRLVYQANRHLRWAFIEIALLAIRSDPDLRAYYEGLRRR